MQGEGKNNLSLEKMEHILSDKGRRLSERMRKKKMIFYAHDLKSSSTLISKPFNTPDRAIPFPLNTSVC